MSKPGATRRDPEGVTLWETSQVEKQSCVTNMSLPQSYGGISNREQEANKPKEPPKRLLGKESRRGGDPRGEGGQ